MTATLRWPLEPPYTRGCGNDAFGALRSVPMERAAPLVRTKAMGRWHRPRAGIHLAWREDGTLSHTVGAVTADEPCDDLPLCGTCEGRAVGAGHPPIAGTPTCEVVYQPRSQAPPPPWCPLGSSYGVRWWDGRKAPWLWDQVFPCPACAVPTRLRQAGGPYNPYVKIQGHLTGPSIVTPCPYHRWDRLTVSHAGAAVCGCGYEA